MGQQPSCRNPFCRHPWDVYSRKVDTVRVDVATAQESMTVAGEAASLELRGAPAQSALVASASFRAAGPGARLAAGSGAPARCEWREQALAALRQEVQEDLSGLSKEDVLHLDLGVVSDEFRQAENELRRPGAPHSLDAALETIRERREEEEAEDRESRRLAMEAEMRALGTAQREAVAAFLGEHGFKAVDAKIRRLLRATYPIHVAAEKGDVRIVELLLREGADPARKDSLGQTPEQVARRRDRGGSHAAVLRALAAA